MSEQQSTSGMTRKSSLIAMKKALEEFKESLFDQGKILLSASELMRGKLRNDDASKAFTIQFEIIRKRLVDSLNRANMALDEINGSLHDIEEMEEILRRGREIDG